MPFTKVRGLFGALVVREIKNRYWVSSTGWVWLFINPVLLLSVYTFVFGTVFSARAPEGMEVPFVAWLAVVLWPWFAFSDGILQGSQGIRKHSALLKKVAMPRWMLPASSHASTFILHLLGYAVVLIVLYAFGVELTVGGLFYLAALVAFLFLFSIGLAFFFSSLQLFFRDLEQALPTFFLFWFFLTPILYSPDMLPESVKPLLNLNPMTWWMEEIRAALFQGKWIPDTVFLGLVSLSIASILIGKTVFDRLSPHFEDFL